MPRTKTIRGRAAPPLPRAYLARLGLALAVSLGASLAGLIGRADGLQALYQTLGGGAYAGAASAPSSFALLVVGVPPLVFCYLFADFLRDGLRHAAASVFVRTERRGLWLKWRIMQLTAFALAYALLSSLLAGLALLCVRAPAAADLQPLAAVLALSATLNALSLLVLLLALNLAAMRANVVACFVFFMGGYLASLLICSAAPSKVAGALIVWLPTTQGVLAWHDAPLTQALSGQGVVPGFSLAQSYCYLAALLFVELLLSAVCVKRLELY